MDDLTGILIVVLLILATSFFVAAEFAIVKVRSTRLDELIEKGNKRAKAAKKIVGELNAYLSTTQLGITVTALILGWIGEPAVAHLFHPLFSRLNLNEALTTTLSTIIGFLIVTMVSVVLGELAPKGIAIQKAERIALAVAYPLMWVHLLFFPFIWILNALSDRVIRLFGIRPEAGHEQALSEGELRLTLANSFKSGKISQGELRYMTRIFDFDERMAREIMVPRTEIVCLYKDEPFEQTMHVLRHEKYTRFPVVEADKDHVIGMVNIKDLFEDIINKKDIRSMDAYIRPILSVLETTPIRSLLEKMQKASIHMAVLTDEYGGTSGLVTVEDILEEIVGEIRDEYDEGEEPMITRINANQAVIDGKMLIEYVNRQFGTDIEKEGVDTIGGWMLAEHPGIPVASAIELSGIRFEVTERDAHQIKKIKVTRVNHAQEPSA